MRRGGRVDRHGDVVVAGDRPDSERGGWQEPDRGARRREPRPAPGERDQQGTSIPTESPLVSPDRWTVRMTVYEPRGIERVGHHPAGSRCRRRSPSIGRARVRRRGERDADARVATRRRNRDLGDERRGRGRLGSRFRGRLGRRLRGRLGGRPGGRLRRGLGVDRDAGLRVGVGVAAGVGSGGDRRSGWASASGVTTESAPRARRRRRPRLADATDGVADASVRRHSVKAAARTDPVGLPVGSCGQAKNATTADERQRDQGDARVANEALARRRRGGSGIGAVSRSVATRSGTGRRGRPPTAAAAARAAARSRAPSAAAGTSVGSEAGASRHRSGRRPRRRSGRRPAGPRRAAARVGARSAAEGHTCRSTRRPHRARPRADRGQRPGRSGSHGRPSWPAKCDRHGHEADDRHDGDDDDDEFPDP